MKALEAGAAADLDYGRYGDTLFELLVTGGRFAGGSVEVEYGESGKLATNVRRQALARPARADGQPPQAFDAAQDVAAVKPYVVAMQHILRYAPRSAPPQSPLTRCLAT